MIFPYEGDQSYACKGKENKAGYLEPELVHDPAKMAQRGPGGGGDGSISARTPEVRARNPCRNAQFSSCRNIRHRLSILPTLSVRIRKRKHAIFRVHQMVARGNSWTNSSSNS